MKNTELKFCFVIFMMMVVGACQTDNRQVTSDMINFPPSSGGQTDDDNLPQITFDSLECNFGTISIGEKFTHIYGFVNTGNSPLLISQVSPSCGCTTPKDWPQEPIAPGESGQITIEFNSKGFPGKIEKTISVMTNCIPTVWNLKLSGEVSGVESEQPKTTGFDMEMKR